MAINSDNRRRPNRGYLADPTYLSPEEDTEREHLRRTIDINGFNWRVWAVAASGFFTDSYNLFATNTILPSIAFVYWRSEISLWRESLINSITLCGSVIGQLVFGYLADRYGRTRLYGVELIIVVFSTIGVASSSTGKNNMSALGWLSVWRMVMGIGIGAEYPLSAVITSEWSSTRARGRMLAAVFLMQPLGQIFTQIVGLAVLLSRNANVDLKTICPSASQIMGNVTTPTMDIAKCESNVDTIWRIVTGVGAIPALLAIIFRFFIGDSWIYDLEVKRESRRPREHAARIYGDHGMDILTQRLDPLPRRGDIPTTPSPIQFSWQDLRKYFIEEGNYRLLLGTSATWFLLDFAFYGLGMGNPRTLAKLFAGKETNRFDTPSWNTNPFDQNTTIYDALYNTARQSLEVVSVASLFGSILFIFVVDRISRRQWLIWSFLSLAALFVLTGALFRVLVEDTNHIILVLLVALCHFAFNFGANTLTFMIPAEIFPTCYRSTCHGISAAAGKVASVIVTAMLYKLNASDPNTRKQLPIFISFGGIMALGALFAWLFIPEVQRRGGPEQEFRLHNETLEDLAEGVKGLSEYDRVPLGLRRRGARRSLEYTDNVRMTENS